MRFQGLRVGSLLCCLLAAACSGASDVGGDAGGGVGGGGEAGGGDGEGGEDPGGGDDGGGDDGGGDDGGGDDGGGSTSNVIPNPILFVTQVPMKGDWANVASASSNQKPDAEHAYRGGDLFIVYPDGTLRNLTEAAGYGVDGLQAGGDAIAVRGPSVHWSATKAVFSMVRGVGSSTWQLYEITGLGQGDTPQITPVPNQPNGYNNVDPIYASDDRILFASDRPRNGAAHLYPQLDEYNSLRTVTGLWSLDPQSGDLHLLNHAPSGAFKPSIDSFGRVVFSRFDHLTRDKQANDEIENGEDLRPFNWSSEEPASVPTASQFELFPEPTRQWIDFVDGNPGYSGPLLGYQPQLVGNFMSRFSPWTMNQDGTQEQTINGVGEHELGDLGNTGNFSDYTLSPSFNDDPELSFVSFPFAPPTQNENPVRNVLQIREAPHFPGMYYAVDARFHDTHASGQLIRFWAPPGIGAHEVLFEGRTHPTTANPYATAPEGHSGFYRNPLPMSDGTLVAAHADVHNKEQDLPGTIFGAYDFKLVTMVHAGGGLLRPGDSLTGGITKDVTIQLGADQHAFVGALWELDPVEVVARTPPASPVPSLPGPEAQALAEQGVTLAQLEDYLLQNDIAIVVSRNVTTRDGADRQQPFNLQVAGTATKTIGTGAADGTLYQVSHLQVLQADQLRGYEGINMYAESMGGRRVLATPQSDAADLNPPSAGGPPGSVALGSDGSMAALVPARRALTWQLVDPGGEPVVRERYWFTMQPGEVRVCTSCHDPNTTDQAGQPPPTNVPQALKALLQHLQQEGAF